MVVPGAEGDLLSRDFAPLERKDARIAQKHEDKDREHSSLLQKIHV